MPRASLATLHLINYIKQSPLWGADLDRAPGWPPCVLEVTKKPHLQPYQPAHAGEAQLHDSLSAHWAVSHSAVLAEQVRNANQTADHHGSSSPQADGESPMILPYQGLPVCFETLRCRVNAVADLHVLHAAAFTLSL